MRFFNYLLFALCLPVMLQAQHLILSAETGFTTRQSHPFEQKYYYTTPGISAIVGIKGLAVKGGGFVAVDTEFSDIYTTYGMLGLSTKLKRRISVHLLAGLCNKSVAKPERGDNIYYNGLSFMINPGLFILPGLRKHFVLGLEAYVWRDKASYLRRNDFFVDRLTLSLSIGYRPF